MGGYFSDRFRAHFGDPDLAMRVWAAGGRCQFTTPPLIERAERDPASGPAVTHKETSLERDARSFLDVWSGRFGRGWPVDEVRHFNIDINIGMQLTLCRDNSVFINDPIFRDLVANYWQNIRHWSISMEPAPAS